MLYKKLIRLRYSRFTYLPNFEKIFPELKSVSNEEITNRFKKLGIEFYYVEKKKRIGLIRLTLPFAFIVLLFMFISLPFVFMVTGRWGYDLEEKNLIYDWFRNLSLL